MRDSARREILRFAQNDSVKPFFSILLNHLQYLTTSTYRRARLFDAERFKRNFITTLGDLRTELGFRIVGYVFMPEW